MHIKLKIYPDHLGAIIMNKSSQEIRLWDLENSWGWYTLSLCLRGESEEQVYIVKRKPRDWTKNAPYFFVLFPGENREIQIDIKDGWWDVCKELSYLKDKSIFVRARYDVVPSPEAEEYCVFTGTVLSNWAVSTPEHHWLFDHVM